MQTKIIILLAAGVLFWTALAGFLYTVIKLRPRQDSDLDMYDVELEDTHPILTRYNKWRNIWLSAIFIAMLLLFAAIAM